MKNVTITLDDKTAAWARVHAARQNMSLSRFIAGILDARMGESREYERAMRRYLQRKASAISRPSDPYPTRKDLYDRPGLR